MDVKSALEQYLNSLDNRTTKINYEIVLRDFIENISAVGQITTNRVVTYKKGLADKAPQTIAARLAAIRSFCDYCWDQGWLSSDPSLSVRANPIEKYAKAKNVSFGDLKKILGKIDITTLVGVRDYLLIRLIFLTGDVKKVIGISWDQDLPASLASVLHKYKNSVPDDNLVEGGHLFFNTDRNNSKGLSLSGARRILTKYAVKAGYPEKFLDFQALKRLRAKQIYDQTGSEEAVKSFCGHKSMKATKAFIKTLK